jgi:hypothetical protein
MGVGLLGVGYWAWAWATARLGSWQLAGLVCLKLERPQVWETKATKETRRAGCVQVGKQKGSGGSQAELKHNSLCVGPPDLTYQHSK